MERLVEISRVFLRFHFSPFLVISFLLTLLFLLFFGIENLLFMESAIVFERFFPMIGLILFIPLFLPDYDQNILEVVQTKKTSYFKILFIRFVQIFIALLFIITICLIMFHLKNSEIQFGLFLFGGIADVFFLSGLLCLFFSFTMHPVTSLIAPIAYYIICLFTGDKYFRIFYFFTLVNEDFRSKLLLLTVGIILIIISCFVVNNRK